jgi:LPS-assembly protein
MKSKFKIIYIIFILLFLSFSTSMAENDLTFESDSIEFTDNGNLITAKNGVKITSQDGLKIFSNESTYSKITKQLVLRGEVEIIDDKKGLNIKSEQIEYDRKLEIINSKKKTLVSIDNNYKISTSNISYFVKKNIVSSSEKTLLIDNFNNKVETEDFIYFINKKEFKSSNLVLTDKDLNKYFSNETMISLTKNEILAKDIQVYFSKSGGLGENARLKGNSMISNNNSTIIKKGIFTSCKKNGSCPPWTIQSEEIKHDKNKKIIEYKNAWLKLYDKPVFYFPKFFHPDPTVKRQSGFLMPSIVSSSISGNSLTVPYFHVLSENKDFTLNPRFYLNNDILLQSEYRQVEKNTDHITDFSFKKLSDSSKSHFFSNTKVTLNNNFFENSDIEINLEKTSNDTYLKSENIKNAINNNHTLLNSFINFNGSTDDLNFFAEISVYEDLTKEKNSDKFQYILPSFKLSKFVNTQKDIQGNLKFEVLGVSEKRNTNVTENYLINDLKYNSNSIISQKGFLSNFDIIYKNVMKKGSNSQNYSDNFESDNFISSILTTSLPMRKNYDNYKSNLVPKMSFRISPFDSENISSLDRRININNLFSDNRLSLLDSLEGGQSLTLGLDYDLINNRERKFFSTGIGQIFRDTDDEKLPLKSTMQSKRSDVVGRFEFSPTDNFEVNYKFSSDDSFNEINYSLIESKFKVNNFVTSFEFLEENNMVGSDSYFSKDISYNFNRNNTLKYNTRRNRKTDLTEFYNLIYEYKNDCLVAAIEYNKDYYEDRDIKPNEEIYFSITLSPITSINSPNFNK